MKFDRTPFEDGLFAGLPRHGFRCILIDPPWRTEMRSKKGVTSRAPAAHYRTMKLPAIKALPVRELAESDCWLFLWTTWPHMKQAFEVLDAWGFGYSSDFVIWVKLNPNAADQAWLEAKDFHVGTGYTSRKNTEVLLLAKRGSPKILSRNIRELLIARRREHSRKPDEAITRIERFCDGPRVEVFARESRPGWSSCGNETAKFDAAAVVIGEERQGPPAPDPVTPLFEGEAA